MTHSESLLWSVGSLLMSWRRYFSLVLSLLGFVRCSEDYRFVCLMSYILRVGRSYI